MSFPKDFIWGAAAASYQAEGGAYEDGKVHDPQRIDFLTRYLSELKRAIDGGIIAKGYFLWTIMDNFEWTFGYRQRFGIIYVDYATGERTFKDSAYWYKDLIASNGGILADI